MRSSVTRILKGAATLAALPLWAVGNAFMVPLLKQQLRREAAKVKSVTAERDDADRTLQEMAIRFQETTRRYAALRSAVENPVLHKRIAESLVRYVDRDPADADTVGKFVRESIGRALAADEPLPAVNLDKGAETAGGLCPSFSDTPPVLGGPFSITGPAITARPPIEGDHPADIFEGRLTAEDADHYPADEKIQGWAAAIEHVAQERDRLREQADADTRRLEDAWAEVKILRQERDALRLEVQRLNDRANEGLRLISEAIDDCGERVPGQSQYRTAANLLRTLRLRVETLTRELLDADRDHDAAMTERQARHRQVLIERETDLATALDLRGPWAWPALLGEVRALRQLGAKP